MGQQSLCGAQHVEIPQAAYDEWNDLRLATELVCGLAGDSVQSEREILFLTILGVHALASCNFDSKIIEVMSSETLGLYLDMYSVNSGTSSMISLKPNLNKGGRSTVSNSLKFILRAFMN